MEEFVLVGKQDRHVAAADRDVADQRRRALSGRSGAPQRRQQTPAKSEHAEKRHSRRSTLSSARSPGKRAANSDRDALILLECLYEPARNLPVRHDLVLAPLGAATEDIARLRQRLCRCRRSRPVARQTSWLKGGHRQVDNGGGGGQSPAVRSAGRWRISALSLDPAASFGFTTLRVAPDQHAPFDILEAYGRYQPISTRDWLWSIKLGAFFPPISLENGKRRLDQPMDADPVGDQFLGRRRTRTDRR